MKTMTIEGFQKALAAAAKQKGETGAIEQKKLILGSYMITDADGVAIDPESIDVHLMPAAGEVEQEMNEEPTMTEEKIAETVAKSVKAAFGEFAPKSPAVRAELELPRIKTYGRLKNFSHDDAGKLGAFRFGTWCMAAMGHKKSAEFCAKNGIPVIRTKAHVEGINSAGGFLVPDEFDSELITLREQFGVFRRNAQIKPMSSDVKRIPKRKSTLTAYFVGEASPITESTQVFDSITLVAKKLGVLTTVSSELSEDAVVNLGDDVAGEIAYAFARKEDECGFLGDGTSTYGGIVGLQNALTDATYQVSDGGATTYATVSLAELHAGLRKLPAWAAQRQNIKIYTSKAAFHAIFERLALAAGGVTAAEIAGGAAPRFFGYPVEFTQVIPVTESGGATFAFIGDLRQGCIMGDRRETSIAFSDSALNAFEQDELAVRGTERFDIVCANVGDATESGALVKMTL